jgi:hypothetical protein
VAGLLIRLPPERPWWRQAPLDVREGLRVLLQGPSASWLPPLEPQPIDLSTQTEIGNMVLVRHG